MQVGCGVVLLRSQRNTWHPNKVWVLGQQVHDVPGKLCRIAGDSEAVWTRCLRFAGLVGQNDREFQLGEKRVPERLPAHVQRGANVFNGAGAWSLRQQDLIAVKTALVLNAKRFAPVLLAPRLPAPFLATVTGDKPVAASR